MLIVKIDAVDGFHSSEFQNGRIQCWKDGYIEVPLNLKNKFMDSKGYCDLIIKNDVLIDVIPSPNRVTSNSNRQNSEIDAIYAMLIEQEYKLTLLELGVNE